MFRYIEYHRSGYIRRLGSLNETMADAALSDISRWPGVTNAKIVTSPTPLPALTAGNERRGDDRIAKIPGAW